LAEAWAPAGISEKSHDVLQMDKTVVQVLI
jgi:hypothetical protein